MSIYSNVTEQDSIILRKLSEQQKNQRAFQIENRILKQTHDKKLAESLSPIIKNKDELNENTQKTGKVIEKSEPEKNKPQPAIEYTQPHQPIENNDAGWYMTLN